MSKTSIIIGAGFKGFCDALQLLDAGHDVHIIDKAPFFGGISYSGDIKGFAVDKGVHMFDSIPQSLADIVEEIMEGKTRTIDFVSVSAFNGKVTDGFSLPDLNSLDDEAVKTRITEELRALAAQGGSPANPRTLLDYLHGRYGETAGNIFADIFASVYNIKAEFAQPDAISRTSLGRLKFLDDDAMMALKQEDPWLDSALAARRKALGKVDDLVSVYPTCGDAMRGWCDRAKTWLEAKGAKIHLGTSIETIEQTGASVSVKTDKGTFTGDHVIWTNDNVEALAQSLGFEYNTRDYISGTPMLFATLITKAEHIKDFTYLQNFNPNSHTYRTASAGIYSGQIDANGNSFITCECPASMDSERWQNSDAAHLGIWQECKDLQIIDANAELVDYSILKLPVTFKVAKLGYDEKIAECMEEVAKRADRVILRDVKKFFRREIYLDSLTLADRIASNDFSCSSAA